MDALAGLRLGDPIPVSGNYQSRDGYPRENLSRIVAHHAQHTARHHTAGDACG